MNLYEIIAFIICFIMIAGMFWSTYRRDKRRKQKMAFDLKTGRLKHGMRDHEDFLD